jgi:Ca2+/Na+ antiporter
MNESVEKAGLPTARRAISVILGGWIVTLAIIVGGMLLVRDRTLAAMSTPEAQAEWDAWRESEVNMRDDLPVKRRPPKSVEPPALVLMRDHFPVLMSAAVVFGSLLYGALAFALRGSMQTSRERN